MTTRIDEAFAVMNLSDSDAGRLRYFETILDSEIFLYLDHDVDNDHVSPKIFEIAEGRFAMAFDTELRLAEFAGAEVQFVEMSGRNLTVLLAENEIGLALNFGAPSENILAPDIVHWMAHQNAKPEEIEQRPEEILPPSLPEKALEVLDRKLAGMGGFATNAYLADAKYENCSTSSLLAFVDAIAGSEQGIAEAIAEALHFSGFEAISIDVIFLDASDPIAAVFAKHGVRFDFPAPEVSEMPGGDPTKPPKLV